jgi:hypothetical protein
MGIFRRIETGLEKAFEGGLGRSFKSHVQPAEIARKLRKEMDDHRTISVSQVYVPNIFTVYLTQPDREQFATFEASLRTELASYLTEYARRQAYTTPGRVRVAFEVTDELDVGMFGIAVQTEEEPRIPDMPPHSASALDLDDALPPEFLDVMPDPPVPVPVPVPAPVLPALDADLPLASETAVISAHEARAAGLTREEWVLSWDGGRQVLDQRLVVVGRSKECDVVIDDRNISRRHAELVRDGAGFIVRDLGSTNGTAVNGRRVREAPVASGDEISLGTVALTLEQART